MKRVQQKVAVSILVLMVGCAAKGEFVALNSNTYGQINCNQVIIVDNRLQIGEEFTEIGVLLVNGNLLEKDVITIAAQKGANIVVKDERNYVFVRSKSFELHKMKGEKHDNI